MVIDIKDYCNTYGKDIYRSFSNKSVKKCIEKNEYIKEIRKKLILKKLGNRLNK